MSKRIRAHRGKKPVIRFIPRNDWTERLEPRVLMSVAFTPAPVTTPTNRPDVALSMTSWTPIEPFVRVNPTDPANVVPSSHALTRISNNGGATFGSTVNFAPPSGFTTQSGDTGMAFDSAGRLFWVNLAGSGTTGVSVSRINPATGASISSVNVGNGPSDDKAFIVADATASSPFADNLYVVWSRFGVANIPVMLSRSTDHGLTWSAAISLSGASENFAWPTSVGVAPNGDVYVAMHANGEAATSGRTLVRRSTDGGVTFAAATQAFTAGQSAVTYNVQTTGSTTIPGTQFWTQGTVQPWVLPDPARPGNVYVVTNDDPNNIYQNGDNANIVLARSTNNGSTWTTSTISAGPSNSFQLFPTASIDRFGDIVVAWYDNRRGLTNANGRYKLDIMATYSTDGGLTWAPEFMVNDSTNPFDPDPGAGNRFAGPPPTTRIGEYFGSDVFGNTAHFAWNANTFSGSTPIGQQVWYGNFAIAGALTVNGDDSGVTNDTIVLRTLSGNTSYFEVLVNGVRQYAGLKEGITGITINGAGGNDSITITDTTLAVTVDGGAGTDTIVVSETDPAKPVVITPSTGDDAISVNTDNSGVSTLLFDATQRIGSLTIGVNGLATLSSGGAKVLTTNTVSVSNLGRLDLTDNDMIVKSMTRSAVESLVATGYHGGDWLGGGITSTTAASFVPSGGSRSVGVIDNNDWQYGMFSGQTVALTDILLKYTWTADATLDGIVDNDDFGQFLYGYNGGGPARWLNADFDYNGFVDNDDFGWFLIGKAAFDASGGMVL